jgi:hypothetical protein
MGEESGFARKLRVLGWQLLVGFILGVVFWEGLGQWMLGKKYGSIGSSVTCAPDVKRALAEFHSGLLTSALVGAGGLVVVVFAIRLWWRRRKRAQTGTPPTSHNPPTPAG